MGESARETAKADIRGFVSRYICLSAAGLLADSSKRPESGLNWCRKGVTVFEKSEQSIAVLTIGRAISLKKNPVLKMRRKEKGEDRAKIEEAEIFTIHKWSEFFAVVMMQLGAWTLQLKTSAGTAANEAPFRFYRRLFSWDSCLPLL